MIHFDQYGPKDLLLALKRQRWTVIVPLWASIVATVLYTQSLPNRYESDVRIQLVAAGVSERFVPSAVRSTLGERLPAITEMVLSSNRLQQIVDELDLYRSEGNSTIQDRVSRIRRDFTARVVPPDSFILTYTAPDAQTAATVAGRLGAEFVAENRRRSEVVAGAATDFLDAQLDDARRRLAANEAQVAEFNQRNAGELPSQLQSNIQILQGAQNQLQAVQDALGRDRDDAEALDRLLADTQASPDAPPDDRPAPVNPLRVQLQAATKELGDLESRLTPEHPDVIRAKRRVTDLEAQLEAAPQTERGLSAAPAARRSPEQASRLTQLVANRAKLERQIASRQAEETRLVAQIEEYRRRIDATPGREAALTALMRDYDTLKTLYSNLLSKKEEAKVSANLQQNDIGEQFVIASPATVPGEPASPNRLQLDIVGTLSGLLIGLGLAALLEYRDTSLRSAEDLTATVGLPLLAAIPVIRTPSEWRSTRAKRAARWLATAGAVVGTVGIFWRLIQ
jgi:polysaccharide chain length determinant protein (PEP-CTERM system associated)